MSNTETTGRPLPKPTAETHAYWSAAQDERLVIQKCRDCDHFQFYPRAFCIECLSDDIEWVEVSGRGKIYTFTICRIAPSPAFAGKLPYVVAVVQLQENVRLLANIVDCDITDVSVDLPVSVCFEHVDETCTIPQFKLTR